MNKHVSTAAAAIALVSAIGLAYAQTSDQPADTNTTAAAQQQDAKDAVDAGTTATPDWRSPDLAAQQANDPNAMPSGTDQMANHPALAPNDTAGDNANATTAPVDQSSTANATDNGMNTQPDSSTSMSNSTSTSSDVITERAPQADRN